MEMLITNVCFIVDAGKFGGINNLIYAQPIISTIGI